jgi:hypothetical protein
VSKRHNTNRRKNYGRRQHELHERQQRDRRPNEIEVTLDDAVHGGMAERFAFLDPRGRMRYAMGD